MITSSLTVQTLAVRGGVVAPFCQAPSFLFPLAYLVGFSSWSKTAPITPTFRAARWRKENEKCPFGTSMVIQWLRPHPRMWGTATELKAKYS